MRKVTRYEMNRTKLTTAQVEVIVAYMESNPKLVSGKVNDDFTPTDKRILWEVLTKQLNNVGGCTKDIKKWIRSWADMKLATKEKVKKLRLQNNPTNRDGRCRPRLTEIEIRIAQLLGLGSIKELTQNDDSIMSMLPSSPPISQSNSPVVLSVKRDLSEHSDMPNEIVYLYDETQEPGGEVIYTAEVTPHSPDITLLRTASDPTNGRPELKRILRRKTADVNRTESSSSTNDNVEELVELQERSNDILKDMSDSFRSMAESFKIIADALKNSLQNTQQ